MQIKGIVWHQARELLSRLVLEYTKVAACIHPPTTTHPTTHTAPARYKPIWETVLQCACWPSHTLMHTLYFCIPYTFAYLTPLDTSMHTLYPCIAYPRPGQPIGLLVAKHCACMHPYMHQRNHSCLAWPTLSRIQVFIWQPIARFWASTKRGLGKICLPFKMPPWSLTGVSITLKVSSI